MLSCVAFTVLATASTALAAGLKSAALNESRTKPGKEDAVPVAFPKLRPSWASVLTWKAKRGATRIAKAFAC